MNPPAGSKRASGPGRAARRLLTLVVAIGIPLVGIEIVANLTNARGFLYFAEAQRYFAWQRYEGVPVSHAHPANGRLEMPWGVITTNAEGWRSPDIPMQPTPATLRVLALGDSVVFGWGVGETETLTRQLEAQLAARLEPAAGLERVEVINTGNGSYSSVDELIVLRDRGLAYQPDLALLVVVGNDFTDRPAYRDQVEFLAAAGPLDEELIETLARTATDRPPAPGSSDGAWNVLSRAVSPLLYRSLIFVQSRRLVLSDGANETVEVPATNPDPEDALLPRFPYLREQTAALREVALTCEAEGIPLVVFVFTGDRATSGLQSLRRYLTDRLEDLAPVVELHFPADRPARELTNSATDPHWNPEGTRWFAARIADALVARLRR